MRRCVVLGDAENRDAQHLELGEVVGELASFGGAARGVVLRIKVHDIPLALEVFGRHGLSLFVR